MPGASRARSGRKPATRCSETLQDTNGDEDPNIKEEDSNDNECVAYKRARRPKELGDLP